MIDFEAVKAQIGIGNLMAVGARDYFTDGSNTLGFKVGSARGSTKCIKITLDPSDTYTVRYFVQNNTTYRTMTDKSIENVYADQLGQIVYSLVNK